MNEFKKCKVVILSSNKKSRIGYGEFQLCEDINGLYIPMADDSKREALEDNSVIYKHLYILSFDEDIKSGDYFYIPDDTATSQIEKAKYFEHNLVNGWVKRVCFKIIASTDTSLNLPHIPNELIKEYIHKQIKEVFVKYENNLIYKQFNEIVCKSNIFKNTFNKEELPIQAIKDCLKYCENHYYDNLSKYDKLFKYGDFYYKLSQFIKENDL